jgi:hypothetical protein
MVKHLLEPSLVLDLLKQTNKKGGKKMKLKNVSGLSSKTGSGQKSSNSKSTANSSMKDAVKKFLQAYTRDAVILIVILIVAFVLYTVANSLFSEYHNYYLGQLFAFIIILLFLWGASYIAKEHKKFSNYGATIVIFIFMFFGYNITHYYVVESNKRVEMSKEYVKNSNRELVLAEARAKKANEKVRLLRAQARKERVKIAKVKNITRILPEGVSTFKMKKGEETPWLEFEAGKNISYSIESPNYNHIIIFSNGRRYKDYETLIIPDMIKARFKILALSDETVSITAVRK